MTSISSVSSGNFKRETSLLKEFLFEAIVIPQDVEHNEYTGQQKLHNKYKRYYIQLVYAIPDQAKMEQEQRSLMLTGDFFKKILSSRKMHRITMMMGCWL